MNTVRPVWICAAALSCCIAQPACSQQNRSSESAGSKAILAEIATGDPKPSRMGTGVLGRSHGKLLPVRMHRSGTETIFATAAWMLRLHGEPFGLELQNTQTTATWKLGPEGLGWTATDDQVPASIESFGRPRETNSRWTIPFTVHGSAETGELAVEALPTGMLHLEVHAPDAFKANHLRWSWQASGPFFGLGERFSETRVDGVNVTLRPEDLLGTPGHNWTYIPVPLLYTPKGMGFYLDTGEVTRFDLRDASRGLFRVQMDHSSADAYLFADAGPKQVLQEYTALTGTTPLSPPWAFGVWLCSYGGPDIVLGTAERLRNNRIPVSALWTFDAMGEGDVMGWPLWRTGYYPSMRTMTDKLHSMGFKSLTYVHPYLRSTLAPYNLPNPMYQMAQQNGFLVHDPDGVPTGPRFEATHDGNIDFTNPAALDWYQSKIRTILLSDGFDGWMEDYGEWINPTDQFSNGSQGRDLQNLYSLLYHRATYLTSTEAKPDVVEFVRSGYAGTQGYTRVVWGGDQFPTWDADSGLPSVVNAGISAGLSGFAVWGPDIEQHGNSKELWSRWVEFGALTPIMRDHPWDNPNGAVNLWYDAETVAIFRKYAGLHMSLFPYFYTYAKEAERTGLPIMRHLMLEYPNDPRAADTRAEYLLGDKLLVAPVVIQGDVQRKLYLPAGEWIDYWTGEAIQGGRDITLAAPVDRIPLLVKAGSVLPMISPDSQTLASAPEAAGEEAMRDLIWHYYPGTADSRETFTSFDGVTATAETQAHALHVHIRNASSTTHMQVVIALAHKPDTVLLSGHAIPEATASMAKDAWSYDAGAHTLTVAPVKQDIDLTVRR